MAAVEIDPDCRGVIARHFPDVALFNDITEVTGDQLRAAGFVPERGIFAFGWPCVDISIAGRRAGLDAPRSGLFWQAMRLAGELSPRWIVAENVPGLLSACCQCPGDGTCMDAGRAVACGDWETQPAQAKRVAYGGDPERKWLPDIAHTPPGGACPGGCGTHDYALGTVTRALSERGFWWAWRILDSQYAGVAQRRSRVFFVGHSGNRAAPVQVLLDEPGSTGNPAPRGEKRTDIAGTIGSRVGGSRTTDLDGLGIGADGDPSYTVDTLGAQAVATLQGGGRRGHRLDAEGAAGGHLIPVAPLPSRDVIAYDTSREGKGANSDAASGNLVVQPAVTHALTSEGADASEDGTGRGTPLVAVPRPVPFANQHRVKAGDVAEPVTGSHGQPGCVVAFSENQRGEVLETDVSHQLATGGGKPGQGYGAVRVDAAVRRLTPKECERLQFLPDDWTRWKSVNGNLVELSDSARYRMIGNAVTVSVVQWIVARIVAVDAGEDVTG